MVARKTLGKSWKPLDPAVELISSCNTSTWSLASDKSKQSRNKRPRSSSAGGRAWKLQFQNVEPKAFFNAIVFWDAKHGIALSDPVDGRFPLIVTDDGEKWALLPEKSRHVALTKEGCFAASGTCLVSLGENDVWFCTGGAKTARVFHSGDRGKTWSVVETPLLAGIVTTA